MSRRTRYVKQTIFIACEGKTEELYFGGIRDEVNQNDKYSVDVKILELEDGTPQDPVGLVREADRIRNEESYDEAWVVFDKDRDRDQSLQQAFQIASEKGISIAFSSISFEEWILLHFEQNDIAFQRSDCTSRGGTCECNGENCICTYLRNGPFPNYKKASYKLYTTIKGRASEAMENAAWLKFQNSAQLDSNWQIQHPYTLNPHTDVDILFARLLDLEKVIYSENNNPRVINQISIDVIQINNQSLTIRVINQRPDAFIINNQCHFKGIDLDGRTFDHSVNTAQLNPGESIETTLTFPGMTSPLDKFRYKDGNLVLVVGRLN